MERKIGETFEFEGETLQVKEIEEHTCEGCFFKGKCVRAIVNKEAGECFDRVDKKNVIFVPIEAREETEQPEPQEEQKLNLLEILKYCPEGEKFWSPMLGDVKFICIMSESDKISVMTDNQISWDINADATITFGIANTKPWTTEEPMLFPSKEQRDWSKVDYKQPIDKLPKSWQEFCETHEVQKGEAYIDDCCNILDEKRTDTRDTYNDKNILPSKEACRQHLALMQLHQLRDCWRQGWKFEPNETRWCITKDTHGDIDIDRFNDFSVFLSFQDKERAEKFLDCFRDLIEQAGDLI